MMIRWMLLTIQAVCLALTLYGILVLMLAMG